MKFKLFYTIFIATGIYLLSAGSSTGPASILNDGYTGAPGDKAGCFATSCHTDTDAFNNVTTIEVIDKSSGQAVNTYDPGVIYEIRVTIDAPGATGYGFQMVCLNTADDTDVAAFLNPGTGVKIATAAVTSRQYAEQSGTSSNNVFSIDWTAPSSATSADVTFYASGNAVDGNLMFSGDDPANATLTIAKSTASAVDENDQYKFNLNLFPLPAEDQLNIDIQGDFKGDYFLEVFNEIGMMVHKESIQLTRGMNNHSIDVSDYSAGSYTIRFYQNSQYKSGRFIKL